ncbi:MAG TPA: UDP-N-acetylmuramoyl-L-alanine--D-glutamate ligase [Candidatus Saccharimonadaceae bacterium]|nr:UDP-N-acetylmuramoyl-L-alanine--D-glutamate ligase [Candidatus Saccharimonadaceae bacterium]
MTQQIAIAGYGIEGRANYLYFRDKGDVTIVDERPQLTDVPPGVPTITGDGVFSRLQDFDLVVRTAGLKPAKIVTNGKVWSATNEFFARCPAPIIGVTGTKGKGTTCSFIASILRAGGKTVHLVGNIGVAALEVLPRIQPDDLVVYELSSFQLWDLERSPSTAVVLMIEPDHLDVHDSMDEYVNAKANIRRYQGPSDVCWYHPTNTYAKYIAETTREGRILPFNSATTTGSVYVGNGSFCVDEHEICSLDAVVIPGSHNLENACAAISAALPYLEGTSMVEAGLRSFTGLPHRLKFVREVAQVRYYDDSIATTPGSALAALRAFTEPKVLILGGHTKGASFDDVLEQCAATNTTVIAIGSARDEITARSAQYHVTCTSLKTTSMQAIVREASRQAVPGGVVLLSPAAASFDMFKNYKDRGDQFIAAVNALAEQ